MTISGDCQIELREFRTQSTGPLKKKICFRPSPVYNDLSTLHYLHRYRINRLRTRGLCKLVITYQRLCVYNSVVLCLDLNRIVGLAVNRAIV